MTLKNFFAVMVLTIAFVLNLSLIEFKDMSADSATLRPKCPIVKGRHNPSTSLGRYLNKLEETVHMGYRCGIDYYEGSTDEYRKLEFQRFFRCRRDTTVINTKSGLSPGRIEHQTYDYEQDGSVTVSNWESIFGYHEDCTGYDEEEETENNQQEEAKSSPEEYQPEQTISSPKDLQSKNPITASSPEELPEEYLFKDEKDPKADPKDDTVNNNTQKSANNSASDSTPNTAADNTKDQSQGNAQTYVLAALSGLGAVGFALYFTNQDTKADSTSSGGSGNGGGGSGNGNGGGSGNGGGGSGNGNGGGSGNGGGGFGCDELIRLTLEESVRAARQSGLIGSISNSTGMPTTQRDVENYQLALMRIAYRREGSCISELERFIADNGYQPNNDLNLNGGGSINFNLKNSNIRLPISWSNNIITSAYSFAPIYNLNNNTISVLIKLFDKENSIAYSFEPTFSQEQHNLRGSYNRTFNYRDDFATYNFDFTYSPKRLIMIGDYSYTWTHAHSSSTLSFNQNYNLRQESIDSLSIGTYYSYTWQQRKGSSTLSFNQIHNRKQSRFDNQSVKVAYSYRW